MLLPNQCSFCAHQRIHAHKSPYCCPECGVLCRSAYFQTHVKENCLHYARKVGYRWVLPGSLSWNCPMASPFSRQELVLRTQTVYVCVGGGVLMRWSSALPTDVVITWVYTLCRHVGEKRLLWIALWSIHPCHEACMCACVHTRAHTHKVNKSK